MGFATRDSLPSQGVAVVLIAVTLFVIAVRPVTRPSSPLLQPLGLTRMSLLSEAAAADDAPGVSPASHFSGLVPPASNVLPPRARTRWAPLRSARVRRLKLPPRSSSARSLLSD